MLDLQFSKIGDLRRPDLFEYIYIQSAREIGRRHGFYARANPRGLANAHSEWVSHLDEEQSSRFTDRQILALAIARAIQICSQHTIVRGEATPQKVVGITSKIAREHANAITAVAFGGAIFGLANKARLLRLPKLPVLEFETATIPKLAGLLRNLETKSREYKTSALFEIVRAFSSQT